MIRKSYLVEENIEVLKKNLVLFYGENIGLIEELKKKIINRNNKVKVIKFSQEEILNNNHIYFNEIRNKLKLVILVSLFIPLLYVVLENAANNIFINVLGTEFIHLASIFRVVIFSLPSVLTTTPSKESVFSERVT